MLKISPCLWFQNNDAAEAIAFYSAIFKDSRIVSEIHWGKQGKEKEGQLLAATFELNGISFQALNGGAHDAFNDAISLSLDCKDQAEVDYYWDKLLEGGGKGVACSWLKDKYGISWQVVPEVLPRLLADPDREKADRVMAAMMQMVKIDVAKIEEAARG